MKRTEEQKRYHREYMRRKAYYKRYLHPCFDCGRLVVKRAIRCKNCALKMRWQRGDFSKIHHTFGEANPRWKGGRYISVDGYVYIHKPNHPRATKNNPYIAEHVLVWEETYGKPLPKGWIVHHLNGVKGDNRPRNLVGFPNKKHYLVLQAKAKRIQELEALLKNQHQLL